MSDLKLWYNDSEWVIAASPDDAWKVLEDETGLTHSDFDLPDGCEFWREWTEPLRMYEHEEQSADEAPMRGPAELIATLGRCYVGSSEW